MATKADVFLDLNRRHTNGDIYPSQYREALEALQNLPESPEMPPERLLITWNDTDGLKVDKPKKDHFSARQRFCLKMARYGVITFTVMVLGLLQSCGKLI